MEEELVGRSLSGDVKLASLPCLGDTSKPVRISGCNRNVTPSDPAYQMKFEKQGRCKPLILA